MSIEEEALERAICILREHFGAAVIIAHNRPEEDSDASNEHFFYLDFHGSDVAALGLTEYAKIKISGQMKEWYGKAQQE